jgi:hypothetical protein
MSAALRRAKMRNNIFFMAFSALLIAPSTHSAVGEKRTILTSGEKVHTIRYQLGQSTVLYFGMKPETVICGNKNYFRIEKIKEGITIQSGSNFSTNLTVLSQGRRFLFYLIPASGAKSDTFVEVRWIPPEVTKRLLAKEPISKQIVRELKGNIRLADTELTLLRGITFSNSSRAILEFELKNTGKGQLKTPEIQIALQQKSGPSIKRQTVAFEMDELKPGSSTKGRMIVIGKIPAGSSFTVKYQNTTGTIKGVIY